MHESEWMTERHQDAVGQQISGKFSDFDPDTTKWIFYLLTLIIKRENNQASLA